ncbi:cobalt ECF transporter T component CbiQ [Egbenema bharatensis]|uniref:cobalt ECF transporter T component CbiQ n=1 Tax=Egbenema bharatensis TaxID=3463334 RepID=UPI003A899483
MTTFDQYAHLSSPIHRWQPRLKLIGLGALIFAFAAVTDLRLILPMLGVTGLLYLLSNLPGRFLLNRLKYPGYFLLGIVLLLPFLSGQTILWQWGWLTVRQEGVLAMVLIVSRFLCIMILTIVLLGTTSFLTTIKAMRSIGLPAILTDMTLLTYRYLYDIAEMFATMQQSMRLRGFRSQSRSKWFGRQDLQQFATLTGTLLIRSYEQSERVYKAMKLRGYGAPRSVDSVHPGTTKGTIWDQVGLATTLSIALSFVAMNLFLGMRIQ